MRYEKDAERYAISAYVNHGVRVALPLSAPARRELARIKRSVAGLAELSAAAAQPPQQPFESTDAYNARILQARTWARAQVE